MITLLPSNKPNEIQKMQIARKYGMFIHFGINTFNDTEWSNGKLPIKSYAPTAIDADGWIKNAKDAGMTYVVIITKHHDGFCLFNTKYTDYSIKNAKNNTDVIGEVAKACKKYGIKLGLYYSLWDRHEKCYKNDKEYVDYMLNQLTELMDGRYGEICELWLDGSWDKKDKKWDIPRIYDLVHTLQPNCAVGTNITIGSTFFKRVSNKYLPEKCKENMPIKYFPSDFRLRDPYFPKIGKNADPKIYKRGKKSYYLPFEATICMRDMRNWFWDPKYTSDPLLETDFIVEKYRTLTEQDNILVVNIAPNTDGKQEDADIERLMDVAKELKIGKYAEI